MKVVAADVRQEHFPQTLVSHQKSSVLGDAPLGNIPTKRVSRQTASARTNALLVVTLQRLG